jgi:hypothetical protein
MYKPTIAVIGAAVVLTLGVGGGAYAVGTISGADIINGTVTTADVKDQTLKLNDLAPAAADSLAPRVVLSRKGPGAYLVGEGLNVFHTMTVPRGKWLVSVTATAFPDDEAGTPVADCLLQADGSSAGHTATTPAVGFGYESLATQITVNQGANTEVTFSCTGVNAGVNNVTITAVEVSRITDLSP